MKATQGASGAATANEIEVEWTVIGNKSLISMIDGALISYSVAEAVKGIEASAGNAATWVVNAVELNEQNLESGTKFDVDLLEDATVTVTYTGAGNAIGSGVVHGEASQYHTGFESEVTINAGGTTLQINQAIKDAINEDSVLSKLLVATDGPANTLVITSLIDGRMVEADLAVKLEGPNLSTTYELSEFATEGGVVIAGNTSTSVSDNKIDLGSGDDVLVLGTDDYSNDTIVVTGSDIGDNTIVNFVNNNSTATDAIDFDAYLDGRSANARIDTTWSLSGTSTEANQVIILNDFAQATTETGTWSKLTASNFLDAIKASNTGSKNHGSITEATLNVGDSVGGLVGTTLKNIVMVENDNNDGEYKIFEVTSTGGSTDEYTAVHELGVMDFGDTISTPGSISGAGSVFVMPADQVPEIITDSIDPIITAATVSYAENQVANVVIATASATDDNGVEGYSITTGNDAGLFSIDAITGQITLTEAGLISAANDFETEVNIFALGVTATDAAGNAATATLTLNVANDEADDVVIDTTAPVITDATVAYDENQVADAVIATAIATDDTGVASYAIATGNDAGLFAIDATTGAVTLTEAGLISAANDFETVDNSFALGVTATDAAGNAATATLTLNTTDAATEIAFGNGSIEDADGGDFQYNAVLADTDIISGNITNFSADDVINIDDAFLSVDSMLFATTTTGGLNQINFAFGDVTDFTPSFTVNIDTTDTVVVADVAAAADSAAALAVLNAAWGSEWLV